jgi:ethanolamine utilization protein EutQ (cupin superfamily)
LAEGSAQYFFSQDHLGSTTALTNTSGALVERESSAKSAFGWSSIRPAILPITGATRVTYLCIEGDLQTELKDGRKFTLKPGMSYQVADKAEPHRSYTEVGARLFIVD